MKIPIAYYVLSAISNDYEDFETISAEVERWAQEDRIPLGPQELIKTLQRLITLEFAGAYTKHSGSREPEAAEFSTDNLGRLYFFVTPQGKRLVTDLDKLSD